MNGKKAKRLRREAEAATIGLPGKVYAYARYNRKQRKPGRPVVLGACTRAVYQRMKKT